MISGGVREVTAAGEDVLAGSDVTSSGSLPSGRWGQVVSTRVGVGVREPESHTGSGSPPEQDLLLVSPSLLSRFPSK